MLDSLWNTISDWMGNTFSSLLEGILNATLFKLFYYIEIALCRIVGILGELFEVFAGLEQASYDGKSNYLINIFFSNKAISNIYMGMALIGVALTVGFTIWAVIKKMFDASGKFQESLGQIITSGFRSLVLIVGLTLIMTVVINGTNILMQRIDYIFNNAWHLDQPDERTFTEEEYAAMGRVLVTVGNYSMVSAKNNRYNLNTCYNSIRGDLSLLERQGVFDYTYYETDEAGNEKESWQSVLSRIAKAGNLNKDVKVDTYNEDVANSILHAMNYLETQGLVTPVEKVYRTYSSDEKIHLDRMLFLMGTLHAAKNPVYNERPALDDALRGPYMYAKGRNIYNIDNVTDDFNIGFPTEYLVVLIAAIALIFDLVTIILNCIARIFNLLFLYIIAPPIIAASPLDNGGKFKQWTTAFLVQALSVFGTVISMRLLLIYLPIVMSPQLEIFDADKQPLLNMFAKFMLVYGGFEVAKKATALLTGILADSAGWQSISAGDMSSSAGKAIGAATGAGKAALGVAKGAAKVGLGVTGFVAKPLTNKLTQPFKNAAEKWKKLGTGGQQKRIEQQVSDAKAKEAYAKENPGAGKYLGFDDKKGAGNGGNQPGQQNNHQVPPPGGNPPAQQNPQNQQNQNNQNNNNANNQNPAANPPPLPPRYQRNAPAGDDANAGNNRANNFRQGAGIGGVNGAGFRDDSRLPGPANRPRL